MKLYFTILLFMLSGSLFGQATVQFIPELYGRNLDGLFNFQLVNPFPAATVTVTIRVTERKGGDVVAIRTPEFTMPSGSTPLPVSVARNAAVQFAATRLGQLTGGNRSFPQGDYDYCFMIKYIRTDNPPSEQCYSYTLAPFADMNLIDPFNKSQICDKRPMFTWQPLLPGIPGAYYQLVLAEVKSGQSPTEAMNYNLPIINQLNILAPVLPYPPIAPELVNQKRYAWQVTAYKDQTILNRSEIWDFTLDCKDTLKKKLTEFSFRDIEDLSRGNYYIASGFIHFKLTNSYKEQRLAYRIRPLDEVQRPVKGLPRISLINGDNYISIDLSENSRFKAGKYYLLEVTMPNGSVKNLRFLYEEVKE